MFAPQYSKLTAGQACHDNKILAGGIEQFLIMV